MSTERKKLTASHPRASTPGRAPVRRAAPGLNRAKTASAPRTARPVAGKPAAKNPGARAPEPSALAKRPATRLSNESRPARRADDDRPPRRDARSDDRRARPTASGERPARGEHSSTAREEKPGGWAAAARRDQYATASANRMGFAGRTGASNIAPATGAGKSANAPRSGSSSRAAPPRGATSAGTRAAPKRSNDPNAPMRRRDTSRDRHQNKDYDSPTSTLLAADSRVDDLHAPLDPSVDENTVAGSNQVASRMSGSVQAASNISASPHSPRSRQPRAGAAVNVDAADHEGTLRLSKRMSELGLCSRREADEWIEHGWVSVDGVVIDTLGTRIRPDQTIEILPAAHADQQDRVTILLNKPIGYVSGQPEDGYPSAATLISKDTRWTEDPNPRAITQSFHAGLAPAGRLDIDSTGLLVLTQDGRIAKQLIGEHSSIDKEYLVRVRFNGQEQDISKRFPAERLALLREGLSLDDKALKPARVDWLNGEQLRFILREGKKRQIRRMCELVGLEVVGLKRVRIGRVALGALPPGCWRYLAPGEFF